MFFWSDSLVNGEMNLEASEGYYNQETKSFGEMVEILNTNI